MQIQKVLKFALIQIIALQLIAIESAPTFGDEFVHIKVHLPKETGGGSGVQHLPSHRPPYGGGGGGHGHGKVAPRFHGHRRRRPHKKASSVLGKHSGLLESIILSEVKKPLSADHYKYLNHAGDIAKHVDTFVIKEEKPKKHVETYTVIEETQKVPKETVETFKVIQSKPETIGPIVPHFDASHGIHDTSSDGDLEEHVGGYHYPKASGNVGGYKAIDTIFDDFHSHFSNVQRRPSHYSQVAKKPLKINYVYADEHDVNDDVIDDTDDDGGDLHDHGGYNYKVKAHYSKYHSPIKSSGSHYKRPSAHHHQHHHHQPSSYKPKSHGYHYEPSSHAHPQAHYQNQQYTDDFSSGYEYKPSYQQPQSSHLPADHLESSYLPPKHQSSAGYNYNQNTLFDDESNASTYDSNANHVSDSYLPPSLSDSFVPPPPAANSVSDVAITDSSNGADAQWPNYKATETYTGIDSYSAAHVQGVGSGGYKYPPNYS